MQYSGGSWSQGYTYDTAYRLATVTAPAGTFTYTYKGAGSLVTNLALPTGGAITNDFDGVARLKGTCCG